MTPTHKPRPLLAFLAAACWAQAPRKQPKPPSSFHRPRWIKPLKPPPRKKP